MKLNNSEHCDVIFVHLYGYLLLKVNYSQDVLIIGKTLIYG